jgi:methylmalonyl-CoA mutase cobalamin-binding domain/chain
MIDEQAVGQARAEREGWEANELRTFLDRQPEASSEYRTASGLPLERVYTLEHVADIGLEALGLPGRYPFTRGPYPTMYRGRTWTMRQIAGYGGGRDTNERLKYLISQGQTGLSVDFDMPTLMGIDSDDPRARGEVGREGVAVDTLDDLRALFEGIDLTQISVSMTINPSAWILLAMYVALAEERGNPPSALSGTTQADILKEYIAQKEWIFPIRPSIRIVRDMITFSAERLPRFNPVSISGYHISEAGGNAVQELAFTIANGITYVDEVVKTGMPVDRFAPRLSFFFVAQSDFFEEIAKFRAARRLWARLMQERFGATQPESMRLRFHTQTAAASLTKAQPVNNVVRTTLQALAAVLGGTQSLHCNGLDEAYAIPTEEAMKTALRTQQIIADESNVTSVADPLGGSFFVESLTRQIEAEAVRILGEIDELGGVIDAIETGYFQLAISDTAYRTALRRSSGEQAVVGVNRYVDPNGGAPVEIHRIDPDVEARQIEALARVRSERDDERVERLLDELESVVQDPSTNVMPITIALVKAHASMGEIVARLRRIFGSYVETAVF